LELCAFVPQYRDGPALPAMALRGSAWADVAKLSRKTTKPGVEGWIALSTPGFWC
jgi:hypothetical protein